MGDVKQLADVFALKSLAPRRDLYDAVFPHKLTNYRIKSPEFLVRYFCCCIGTRSGCLFGGVFKGSINYQLNSTLGLLQRLGNEIST